MDRETLAKIAREARIQAGFASERAAADAIGCSRTLIIGWESETGTGTIKSSKFQRAAARAYKVRLHWLADGIGESGFPYEDGDVEPISTREATISHPASTIRKVPVRGTASMGLDGFWVDLEYPQGDGDGYFEHPTSDPDAYVLRVKGDSMFPAIRSGWYVLIEPNAAIHQGEYVLVKLVDGRKTVKELLWHRSGEYSLLAVSNGERMTIPEDQVTDVHPVVAVLPPSKHLM